MSSKRHQRRKACDGKRRYETSEEAVKLACYLTHRDGYPMRAYKCQFCRGYHVGHMPRKNIRAMAQAREVRG